MPETVLNIDCSLNGRDGSASITVKQGENVLAVDVLNILDSNVRDEYVRKFCKDNPGIREKDFGAKLLQGADKIAKAKVKAEQSTQSELLVELATQADLFHAPGGDEVYATMTVESGHRETWAINSTGFRHCLNRMYYKACGGKVPNAETMKNAINTISAMAIYEGDEVPVFLRLAKHDGSIYLDLADESWRAVKIDSKGWEIVESENVPVRFIRKRGMLPIPVPVSGGSIDELYNFVNLPDADLRVLFVGWLLAALRPSGPYPLLTVNGEQGSAKSTLCRFARMLIDPNKALLRRPPKNEHDLMICASNSHIIAFDNLSGLRSTLADGLCGLATGVGFATRQLYSDGEEKLFSAARPIIVNGIEDVATRPDLVDRSVLLTLPQIPPEERKEESDLEPEFEEARPRILGAFLDAVSCALRRYDETQLREKPRMADFARWVTAAEPAFGWAAGAFLKAYLKNRSSANESAIDASPVGPAILEFMRKVGKWQGIFKDLLVALNAEMEAAHIKEGEDWPKTARGLSGQLRRIAPSLRAVGIRIDCDLGRSKHGKMVALEYNGKTPTPPTPNNLLETKNLEGVDSESVGSVGEIPLFLEGSPKNFNWVLELSSEDLPTAPFTLKPGFIIMDGGKFLHSLQADIAKGPQGPRARTGALQEQCRDLARLLANSVEGLGT